MKKIVLLALAASTVAVATPAAAQVTGSVEVKGNVAARCSVVPGESSGSFTGTIDLETLDEADGTLKADLEGSDSTNPAGPVFSTRVVCNSASVDISVDAGQLSTGASADGTDYSNDIDYTAELEVNTTSGLRSATYNTFTQDTTTATQTVGRLAGGSENNVKVRAYALAAEGGVDSLLVAGDYTSTIDVTISPVAAAVVPGA